MVRLGHVRRPGPHVPPLDSTRCGTRPPALDVRTRVRAGVAPPPGEAPVNEPVIAVVLIAAVAVLLVLLDRLEPPRHP